MGMPEELTGTEVGIVWTIRVVAVLLLIIILNYVRGCA